MVNSLSIASTDVANPEWVSFSPENLAQSLHATVLARHTVQRVEHDIGRSLRPVSQPRPAGPCRSRPLSCPSARHALAIPRPDVSETSRSADQPPISTATFMRRLREARHVRSSIPAPRPSAPSTRAPHFLAERLDRIARRGAGVDQKIGMLLADLGSRDFQPPAPGGVDQLPGLAALWVLEGRATRLRARRLRGLACVLNFVHVRADCSRFTGFAPETAPRRRCRPGSKVRMAVGEAAARPRSASPSSPDRAERPYGLD